MKYQLILSFFIISDFAVIFCMEKPNDPRKRKNEEPELFENFMEDEEIEDVDFKKIYEIMDSIMLDITVNKKETDYIKPIKKLYELKNYLDLIEKKVSREKLDKIYEEVAKFMDNARVIFTSSNNDSQLK